MPVYEYKCNACGREFEVQQRMSDPELTDCDVCGKPALERLISRTAFSLKGGGWYKDLYSSTKPESKSETKTESKADAGSSSDGGSSSSSSPAPSSTPASSGASTSGSGSSGGSTSGGSSGTKAAAGAS